ncbi:hypothetical protein FRB95_002650 [Tulasnella sp. JGI-2019a]|nr:hypothetical protein FRB95_002650 [Tulasnella sp. JGI-2019a]
MLVCSRWEALSVASPLWAHLSTEQPLSVNKNLLSKSKDALLDVVYTPTRQSPWPARIETNSLLPSTIHRWRSLEYKADGYDPPTYMDAVFMDLHHLTAPNLNSVSFCSPSEMFFKLPLTTRLRHISLLGCFTPWNSSPFCGLGTLKLYSLEDEGPSVDQLIDLLRASPGLVTLSLGDLDLQGTLSNHADIITLEPLETLEMWCATYPIAGDLLSIIRIPRCTKFRLKNDHFPDNKLLGPSMEHLFPMFQAIIDSCDYIDIAFADVRLNIIFQKSDEEMLEIRSSITSELQDWPISTSKGLRKPLKSCPH